MAGTGILYTLLCVWLVCSIVWAGMQFMLLCVAGMQVNCCSQVGLVSEACTVAGGGSAPLIIQLLICVLFLECVATVTHSDCCG